MKLTYYIGTVRNFGDDLNPWLWPRLLPGFFDDDASTVFLGIGSILGLPEGALPGVKAARQKIVFGSGFVPSYSEGVPNVKGRDWDVFFVRGPRTARALGLDEKLGIGDSALLLRQVVSPVTRPGQRVSFIPHWESLNRGHWEQACALAGVDLIDPRRPVDEVLTAIRQSRVVLAEAMHGAIVADALRVPWVPLMPLDRANRDKWFDWADSLGMTMQPHRLCPSGFSEVKLRGFRRVVNHLPFKGQLEKALIRAAALRLQTLAKAPPFLSEDAAIERVTARMVEKLDELKRRYGR